MNAPLRHIRVAKICQSCAQPYTSRAKYFCSRDCAGNTKHGLSGTKEHATWLDMRNRCRNPDYWNYARYGGRGITVCDRWDDFELFLKDMGPRPGPGYSIERKDNDGPYEPENCKWGTKLEQSRNRSISWRPDEDQRLEDLLRAGLRHRDIAAAMGRTALAVSGRASKLGIKSRRGSGGRLLPLSPQGRQDG